jgi:hypothetical protein
MVLLCAAFQNMAPARGPPFCADSTSKSKVTCEGIEKVTHKVRASSASHTRVLSTADCRSDAPQAEKRALKRCRTGELCAAFQNMAPARGPPFCADSTSRSKVTCRGREKHEQDDIELDQPVPHTRMLSTADCRSDDTTSRENQLRKDVGWVRCVLCFRAWLLQGDRRSVLTPPARQGDLQGSRTSTGSRMTQTNLSCVLHQGALHSLSSSTSRSIREATMTSRQNKAEYVSFVLRSWTLRLRRARRSVLTQKACRR